MKEGAEQIPRPNTWKSLASLLRRGAFHSIDGFVFDIQFVFFPGFESAFQFHDWKPFAGKNNTGVGCQMTNLSVTIHHIGLTLTQARGIIPAPFGQINGAWKMS